ncbi:MAG: archease [Actinomycetota bacterium]|nr:archease [Actinomycetota bacterium]
MKNKKNISRYRYIDHISDIGIEFYGNKPAQLFENAAAGMFSIMCDLKLIKPAVKKNITVKGKYTGYEDLMVSWLERLIYLYEIDSILFSEFKVAEIKEKNSNTTLKAEISGEKIDLRRHKVRTAVKAVTYHKLMVGRNLKDNNWKGRVIFDI